MKLQGSESSLVTMERPAPDSRHAVRRRDAEKLARNYRAGDLTAVWVPDAAHEALRDLVRARLAAKRDQLRARHRLAKFLLRHGRRATKGMSAWTDKYLAWVSGSFHRKREAQLCAMDVCEM
jgi:transposase